MAVFASDGIEIFFEEAGQGNPVLLIHGFASNGRVNWTNTGWVKTLAGAGHRVIAIDNRGHGFSAKLYDPAQYSAEIMAEDARRLLDHLAIPTADVIGYSMGARIAAFLAVNHGARVRRAVFAGLAARMMTGVGDGEAVARALEARSVDDIEAPGPRGFRIFAEQTKSDLRALAACMRSIRPLLSPDRLATITAPVLVVAGERDEIAGPVEPLVQALPHARGVVLPERNHMNAVGDRRFKQEVLGFLS